MHGLCIFAFEAMIVSLLFPRMQHPPNKRQQIITNAGKELQAELHVKTHTEGTEQSSTQHALHANDTHKDPEQYSTHVACFLCA